MASLRCHLAIDAAADRVWQLVGAPERLHEWFPVRETEVRIPPSPEARDRGALGERWVALGSGLRFAEHIVTLDHDQMRFQYRIVDNALITAHIATVDVLADGPERCIVVYSTDMEPAPLALTIVGAAFEGLHTLRRMFTEAASSTESGVA